MFNNNANCISILIRQVIQPHPGPDLLHYSSVTPAFTVAKYLSGNCIAASGIADKNSLPVHTHLLQRPGTHSQPLRVFLQYPSRQRFPLRGAAQYPSVHTYCPLRQTQFPPIHIWAGEGAMGLTRTNGAVGLTLITNCASPVKAIITIIAVMAVFKKYFFILTLFSSLDTEYWQEFKVCA